MKLHIKIFVLCCVLAVGWQMFSAAAGEEAVEEVSDETIENLLDAYISEVEEIAQEQSINFNIGSPFYQTFFDNYLPLMCNVELKFQQQKISNDSNMYKKMGHLKSIIEYILEEKSLSFDLFFSPETSPYFIALISWFGDFQALQYMQNMQTVRPIFGKYYEALTLPVPDDFIKKLKCPIIYLASLEQKGLSCGLQVLANAHALQFAFANDFQNLSNIMQIAVDFLMEHYFDPSTKQAKCLEESDSQALLAIAKERGINNIFIGLNVLIGKKEEQEIKTSVNENTLTHFIVYRNAHWVLLTYHKNLNTFFYMDSLNAYLRGGSKADRSSVLGSIEYFDNLILKLKMEWIIENIKQARRQLNANNVSTVRTHVLDLIQQTQALLPK